MNKKLPAIIIGIVIILLAVLGFIFWQKSTIKTPTPNTNVLTTKKVDMKSQPEWVQKLELTAVKGPRKGTRGLDNVVFTLSGMPSGMVSTLLYTMPYYYKTAQGEGSGGFQTETPVKVDGAETFTRTFDFGTCSTNTCVRHDGVTAIDVQIDFRTQDGDTPIWSGTVEVK